MKSKEKKYQEMFYAEAYESQDELNKLFTDLEKHPENSQAIEAIFRITHTLKGNAMAIGLEGIAELSHVLEDIFSFVKEKKLSLEKTHFNDIFRANDKLGELIEAIKSEEEIPFKGLIEKLHLILENSIETASNEMNTIEEKNETNIETNTHDKEENFSKDIHFSDQVQVPVRKLDNLLNLVGELIIEKDTIIAQNSSSNTNEFKRLHRITSDMQYAIMDIRLVQMELLFNKFHRIVRDVSEIEEKNVNLHLSGSEIEIDRNILRVISDSLVHLVRNAISHGIESQSQRSKAGKNAEGSVHLKARNEKDTVFIEVIDDGKGIDPQIITNKAIEKGIITQELSDSLTDNEKMHLIFEAGFSNAEKVTEISGRGVGMDVVKRSTESIGGQVLISSEIGVGTTITLMLPSSMAVKGALLFEQNEQEYAVPLSYTEAVVSVQIGRIHRVGAGLMTNYLEKTIPLVFLDDVFSLNKISQLGNAGSLQRSLNKQFDSSNEVNVIILNYNDKYIGIVVDKLLQQKEIVEKPLSKPLDKFELFTGATILGNGNVCLVINITALLDNIFKERRNMQITYSEAV